MIDDRMKENVASKYNITTEMGNRFFQDFSLELGEILLSVAYLPSAKRLNLDLLRAKQLLQTNVTAKSGERSTAIQ